MRSFAWDGRQSKKHRKERSEMKHQAWLQQRLWMAALVLFAAAQLPPHLRAQQVPDEVAEHGYADSIYINGHIVSMDDHGYNTSPGHIYEALAVKRDRIIGLGTTEHIKTLANAKTKVYDLGGMTVIPGLIDTHNHNFGGQVGPTMGINAPDTGISVNVQAGKDIETTRLRIETAIADSVKKVKPGEWINVGIDPNKQEGISANRIFAWVEAGELE